jgi:hypothetical protein
MGTPIQPYPGMFYVTDNSDGIGLTAGPTGVGTTNATNLQQWVYNLLDPSKHDYTSGQGGTLIFPSNVGSYALEGTISIGPAQTGHTITYPQTIIFKGTGQDSQDAVLLVQQSDADLFVVQNNPGANDNLGGVTFQDLYIKYTGSISQTSMSSAIRITDSPNDADPAADGGGLNVRIFRMVFQDCPVAVTFAHSGHCNMTHTSIISTSNNANTKYGVIVGDPTSSFAAIETYIADCYLQTWQNNTGQTGVLVNNSEHLRMMNTRIEAFQYGIVMSPTGRAFRSHFENVSIREFASGPPLGTPNGGGLVIKPPSAGAVQETAFVNCEFGPSDANSTPTSYNQAGVTIDTSSGTVDVLRFISCTSIGWHGPGLQIINGAASNCAHVEILGGEYSGNGQPLGAATLNKLGILIGGVNAVSNAITNVRIAGVSCLGGPVLGFAAHQNYGIYVGDGANDVIISDCDLTGNLQGAASVGSGGGKAINVFIRGCNVTGYSASPAFQFNNPDTSLAITDCAGYNDQGTALGTGALPAGQVILTSASLKYYGPVVLYVPQNNTISHILINAEDTGLTWGTFTLPPGGSTSATIKYSSAPAIIPIGM